jgi:hypothetical protein
MDVSTQLFRVTWCFPTRGWTLPTIPDDDTTLESVVVKLSTWQRKDQVPFFKKNGPGPELW